jgi:hypothetical protein
LEEVVMDHVYIVGFDPHPSIYLIPTPSMEISLEAESDNALEQSFVGSNSHVLELKADDEECGIAMLTDRFPNLHTFTFVLNGENNVSYIGHIRHIKGKLIPGSKIESIDVKIVVYENGVLLFTSVDFPSIQHTVSLLLEDDIMWVKTNEGIFTY